MKDKRNVQDLLLEWNMIPEQEIIYESEEKSDAELEEEYEASVDQNLEEMDDMDKYLLSKLFVGSLSAAAEAAMERKKKAKTPKAKKKAEIAVKHSTKRLGIAKSAANKKPEQKKQAAMAIVKDREQEKKEKAAIAS